MSEKVKKSGRTGLIITSVAVLILLVAGGIFAYTKYLKRNTAELIAVVPSDAAFVFQINDNEGFVRSIGSCKASLNEVFSLDALAGFEYFADMGLANNDNKKKVVISGHSADGQPALLFAVYMQKYAFYEILKNLKINPKDYVKYETRRIYTATTHFHEFKICYLNGIFVAAETQPLLEAAIHNLAGSGCLTSLPDFQPVNDIIHKNVKQNWLILNHVNFVESQSSRIDTAFHASFGTIAELAGWSAYQIRFSDNEVILSGYSTINEGSFFSEYEASDGSFILPDAVIPASVNGYVCSTLPKTHTLTMEVEEGDSTVALTAQRPFEDVVCFRIRRDTNLFHYMVIPADSAFTRSDSLYLSPTPKEESAYRGNRIFLCNAADLATLYPQLKQDFTTAYALLYNDFYVLTESYAAARAYLDDVTTGKVLASNQQYQFTKGNLPTGKGFELYYINNSNQFNQYFTRSFLKKKPGITNLKVFAFSFQKPVGNLLPNTVYLRFAEAQK
jgi:hypothetical protein